MENFMKKIANPNSYESGFDRGFEKGVRIHEWLNRLTRFGIIGILIWFGMTMDEKSVDRLEIIIGFLGQILNLVK